MKCWVTKVYVAVSISPTAIVIPQGKLMQRHYTSFCKKKIEKYKENLPH